MKKTGGHAFPDFLHEGMTLRDYFAAKAMQGLLSSPRSPLGGKEDVTDLLISRLAYVMADAMLKARE
jgi:hypothetical protein